MSQVKPQRGAIAVDLGATSIRFAAGWREDEEIRYEVIEQIPHQPNFTNGRYTWDLDHMLGLVRRGAEYGAARFGRATLGIDSWGVDHGFLDSDGELRQPCVAYRDPSHAAAFAELAEDRPHFYSRTGIQHQPFNTLYQLVARGKEDPSLRDCPWLILPDLIGYLLTREHNMELTQASTTQLLSLDGTWASDIFERIGWPVPEVPATRPGHLGSYLVDGVRLAFVGSHDTASAVYALMPTPADAAFLNVGTWSLLGTVMDQPLVNEAAEAANFTNERTVDGRVRFLKNVPGFFVINRLFDELRPTAPTVPHWLATADLSVTERLNLDAEDLFNPVSMVAACQRQFTRPIPAEAWAGIALLSLVDAVGAGLTDLQRLTGVPIREIRLGGGGSRSELFRDLLADRARCPVVPGPAEATVVGNLALQFKAQDES